MQFHIKAGKKVLKLDKREKDKLAGAMEVLQALTSISGDIAIAADRAADELQKCIQAACNPSPDLAKPF